MRKEFFVLGLFVTLVAGCDPSMPSVSDSDTLECAKGTAKCDKYCVDLNSDIYNCGTCGESCNGNSCINGACSSACENHALHNCSDKCVAFGTDNENCGGCGIKCPDTHQCIATRCAIK